MRRRIEEEKGGYFLRTCVRLAARQRLRERRWLSVDGTGRSEDAGHYTNGLKSRKHCFSSDKVRLEWEGGGTEGLYASQTSRNDV